MVQGEKKHLRLFEASCLLELPPQKASTLVEHLLAFCPKQPNEAIPEVLSGLLEKAFLNFVLFQELKKGSKSVLVKEMVEAEIWPGGV